MVAYVFQFGEVYPILVGFSSRMHSYVAYEQFVSRKLRNGESPDVYLAELRRLPSLFDGISDKTRACAF
ncbi:hypothetical protein O3P69_019069 [Scylla paramamosain]|uniref:Uncharacterized protein n=1 Tax=Scylla paramamosain TaxID=85552 RepID=A0AAW0TAN4_SCYPA